MDILKFFKQSENYKKIKSKFEKIVLAPNRLVKAEKYLDTLCRRSPLKCLSYKKVFFSVFKDIEVLAAIEVGEELMQDNPKASFVKVLAVRHKRVGNLERYKELLISIDEVKVKTEDKKIYLYNTNSIVTELEQCTLEQDAIEVIADLIQTFPDKKEDIYKICFSTLKDKYTKVAIIYGKKYIYANPLENRFLEILLKRMQQQNLTQEIDEIKEYLKTYAYLNKIKESTLFTHNTFANLEFTKQLDILSKKLPSYLLEEYILYALESFPHNNIEINKIVFMVTKDDHEAIAIKYAKIYIDKHPEDIRFLKVFKHREGLYKQKLQCIQQKEQEANYIDKFYRSKLFNTKPLALKTYSRKIEQLSKKMSSESLEKIIDSLLDKFPEQKDKIFSVSFTALKDNHTKLAVMYGEKYIVENPENYKFAKVLIVRMEKLKLHEKKVAISKQVLIYHEDKKLRYIVTQNDIKIAVGKLEALYENKQYSSINKTRLVLEKKYKKYKDILYREFFKFYFKKSYIDAEKYGLKSLNIKYNEYMVKELYDLHMIYGHMQKAVLVLPKESKLKILEVKTANGNSLLDLYHNGFDLEITSVENYSPVDKKVFYLLHNRLPYNSGGYATRSHGLLTGVSEFGWIMNGVSRLGYPEDKMPEKKSIAMDTVENIDYHRLSNANIGLGKLPLKEYLEAYAKSLLEIAQKERPSIIHAASNYMNGVVGNYVAKCLNIPFVYEVRGLWEITRISRQPEWEDTEYYQLMVKMETEAAQGANKVFTLTEALKAELVKRGVNKEKIHLLPNGVISDRFEPLEKNEILSKKLNINDKTVIGFIGSFAQYEGIEYIVDAIELLVNKGRTNIVGLMVGDGAVWEEMVARVKEKKLDEYFIFTGRIPHDKVEEYYSLVDIAPLPRKGLPVCEMVSPLKPFEAMAMEKVVLSSNVDALAEIVQHNYNGYLFEKDNIEDLAVKIEILADDPELRRKLGRQAREWVVKERDWKIISKRLDDVYKVL